MKSTLPPSAKVSKDAKECMQECVSELISFITSEATDKCLREKRKTINGEDVLFSMYDLGFENYAEVLKIYLAKYREQQALRQERGESKLSKRTLQTIVSNNLDASQGMEQGFAGDEIDESSTESATDPLVLDQDYRKSPTGIGPSFEGHGEPLIMPENHRPFMPPHISEDRARDDINVSHPRDYFDSYSEGVHTSDIDARKADGGLSAGSFLQNNSQEAQARSESAQAGFGRIITPENQSSRHTEVNSFGYDHFLTQPNDSSGSRASLNHENSRVITQMDQSGVELPQQDDQMDSLSDSHPESYF